MNEYEKFSGQLINFDKSLLYFSSNVGKEIKNQIGSILGVRKSNNPKKYLGLPTIVRRSKKNAFVEIKEKFIKRMKLWSVHNLSLGENEVFIKVVVQALSTYSMQCFNLLVSLCRELENLM